MGGLGEFFMDFHEVHETTNSVYMVVEYIPGGELLKQISTKKSIKERYIQKLIRNLLIGLAHIHEKRIMHRDLKPENIMVANKKKLYKIRIIDFGLGTFIDQKEYLYKRCGTPGYVAP